MTTGLPASGLTPKQQFGQRLRQIRDDAGLQVKQVADIIGLDSTLATRIERGDRWPKPEVVTAFAAATGLGASDTEDLLGYLTWCRDLEAKLRNVAEDARAAQDVRSRLFEGATQVRTFAVTSIPFYLQSAEYARQQLGDEADYRDVIAKRRAGREAVGAGRKSFEIVLSEAALRFSPCDEVSMRQQLSELHGLIAAKGVGFGIIPFGTGMGVTLKSDFSVFDDTALVESFAGTADFTPKAAAGYARLMDRLLDEAVYGEEARALLIAAANALPNA